jgi:hypothetical protein
LTAPLIHYHGHLIVGHPIGQFGRERSNFDGVLPFGEQKIEWILQSYSIFEFIMRKTGDWEISALQRSTEMTHRMPAWGFFIRTVTRLL